MTDQFQLLRDILMGRAYPDVTGFSDSSYLRLLQIIKDINYNGDMRDLVALVRHVLRREEELQGGAAQTLKVKATVPWPSREMWLDGGINAFLNHEGWYTLQAETWRPEWLPGVGITQPEKDIFAGKKRRNFEEVDGDPLLSVMSLNKYHCAGQREAVRAVLTAPSGSTLLVNLPTGAGKSLCAHLPALLHDGTPGVTVVVVPTTALCIDQERVVSAITGYPTAYFGGLVGENRERNREIVERIKAGTQRIVFTSPEALTQSLCGPVYLAARRGHLRLMVIDEAHIVDQWGDDFRSSFQELAGLRNDLLRVCRGELFRTLLLSATVTEPCLETLEVLFGRPGPFEIISAVQLRPEPSFWFSYCDDEETKEQRVLEALNNLPRPLILYVSRKVDANQWLHKLKTLGYRRVEVFTGDTNDLERLRIIEQWREKKTDLIVANSAFGLGVDQADVRAVVHACVPENLDRYYQEVGRGGRDGLACISLLLYCDSDLDTARRIGNKTLIGLPRGQERWASMFKHKEILSPGYYRVPLNVAPSRRPGDIDMKNDYSVSWNIRTLTLMSRAGLIELDSEVPPWLGRENKAGEENEVKAFEEAVESYKKSRVVRVLNENHLDSVVWNKLVKPIRQKGLAMSLRGMELMKEVLDSGRCVGEILAHGYRVEERREPVLRRGMTITISCGGCPFCRQKRSALQAGQMPVPAQVWEPVNTMGPGLSRLFGGGDALVIFYENQNRRRDVITQVERLTKWAIQQGTRNLVLPDALRPRFKKLLEDLSGEIVFLSDELQTFFMPRLPVFVIHPEGVPVPVQYYRTPPRGKSIPRVLLLPAGAIDPERGHCELATTLTCRNYQLQEFCTEVGL